MNIIILLICIISNLIFLICGFYMGKRSVVNGHIMSVKKEAEHIYNLIENEEASVPDETENK